MLIAMMTIVSFASSAAGVSGTYRSTTAGNGYTDDTYPAKFYYDATLTLSATGGGSFKLTCTDIDEHVSGWIDPSMIGRSQTVSVDYTVVGSSVTITVNAGTFSFDMRVTYNGGRLTGSGAYVDPSSSTNSWTLDVTKGGGGTSSMGVPALGGVAGAAGIGGFLAGFGASILPPPRYMGGSILRPINSPLGTPYAPSQSVVLNHQLSSMAGQGNVTRPLPDVPRMQFGPGPIQFPNVQMGQQTVVQPTEIRQTDALAKRFCPNCGSTLSYTAAGWGCPFCHRAPPGGLDR